MDGTEIYEESDKHSAWEFLTEAIGSILSIGDEFWRLLLKFCLVSPAGFLVTYIAVVIWGGPLFTSLALIGTVTLILTPFLLLIWFGHYLLFERKREMLSAFSKVVMILAVVSGVVCSLSGVLALGYSFNRVAEGF